MDSGTQQDGGMLAQILVKQTEMATDVALIKQQVMEKLPDHETRLRSLERFRWTLAGGLVILSGASSFAGYVLGHTIR